MALRRYFPAAAKRLGVVSGHQRTIYPPAIGSVLDKEQANLVSSELGFQYRNFRCSPSYLNATEPHMSSRTSPVNASAEAEAAGSKKKGKKGKGPDGKGSSVKSKIKERSVVYECQECEALCVKRVQQEHLEKGVVIIRCLECRSVNLVADNLGLFKEKGSMQKFLSERGVDVVYGAQDSYELLSEDLVKMAEMDEQKQQQEQQQQQQQPQPQQQQEATIA